MNGIRIIALFARRGDMTHEAFRDRYEAGHVPFIERMLPPFGSYRRNYVSDPAAREALGYDVVTEAWFADSEAHARVLAAFGDPDIANAIATDEAEFIDRDKSVAFMADSMPE